MKKRYSKQYSSQFLSQKIVSKKPNRSKTSDVTEEDITRNIVIQNKQSEYDINEAVVIDIISRIRQYLKVI